jgi:ATP-dependent Clp protease ATP-binding subunit ClpA
VFLFTGPTGVGKTFMAECLAQAIFGVESDALLRLNMNEYKEPYDLARLAGAAPGLIGHDRPGVLFRFVESHPQGVILLDEIEKAHFEIQDYFLQIFDKAESVDSRGRKADFRQYLFVLTCNVQSGARPAGPIGFLRRDEKAAASRNEAIVAQLKQHFRPEFLGRLDGVIDFNSLSAADYGVLFQRQLEALERQFRQDKGIELKIDEQAREQLRHMLSAQADGVRGMMHRFRDLVEAPLIRFVGANPARDRIEMTWKNSELVIE